MRGSKREIKEISSTNIERVLKETLERVGVQGLSSKKVALLLRLFLSEIALHFFTTPDSSIKAGFIRLKKNPDKEELFSVEIIKSFEDGIENAESLNKFYKGELIVKNKLKNMVNEFVEELIDYSQSQEENITELTMKLNKK